jgi:hypothetical protein
MMTTMAMALLLLMMMMMDLPWTMPIILFVFVPNLGRFVPTISHHLPFLSFQLYQSLKDQHPCWLFVGNSILKILYVTPGIIMNFGVVFVTLRSK